MHIVDFTSAGILADRYRNAKCRARIDVAVAVVFDQWRLLLKRQDDAAVNF